MMWSPVSNMSVRVTFGSLMTDRERDRFFFSLCTTGAEAVFSLIGVPSTTTVGTLFSATVNRAASDSENFDIYLTSTDSTDCLKTFSS